MTEFLWYTPSMQTKLLSFVIFILSVLFILAITEETGLTHTYLTNKINTLLITQNDNLNIGIFVQELKTGKVLYEKNANHYFAPASNQKLFTAFAALHFLGTDFFYRTQLFADISKVRDATLPDNIYLKFSGDPTLDFSQLDALFSMLAQKGVRTIAGKIIIDDTRFDRDIMGPGMDWDDRVFCFAAPISAIIINKNCVNITSPLPLRYALSDPRANIENTLASILKKNNLTVTQGIQFEKMPEKIPLFSEVRSPQLPILIMMMLKNSDNLIANSVFKTMGASYSQQPGSYENGKKALHDIILQATFMDLPLNTFFDGAGGSAYNFHTPREMVMLLQKIASSPLGELFYNSLPISGLDGTLKNRMADSNTLGLVRAKTGTMTGVSTLSGYLTTQKNHQVVFSIMINGFVEPKEKYRELEDTICKILVESA